MVYIKISAEDGTVTAVEAIESPVYVLWQEHNQTAVRCSEVRSQGILSLDGSTTYQLLGKAAMPNLTLTATLITMTEYEELVRELADQSGDEEDTEDITPEVPEDTTEDEILTRAELTAKVKTLEEELSAAKILLGVE